VPYTLEKIRFEENEDISLFQAFPQKNDKESKSDSIKLSDRF